MTTDVVRWLTGTGWAVAGSVFATLVGFSASAAGLMSGAAAFVGAFTVRPSLGIYDPIWDYDGKTLWKDATAHLAFGAPTGSVLVAIGVISHARD